MRKIPPPYSDTGPAYLFRHGGAAKPGMLDFSASINPLGPPPSVLEAIRNALPEIARYPDPDCRELGARLAALHNVTPEQIVVGNGSNELIHAIARAFRPKRVAIVEPTYTEYLRASLAVGAAVDHWLAEGDSFQWRMFDPEGAELIWLANPNNPTGGLITRQGEMCVWFHRHPSIRFVLDEAYLPLARPRGIGDLSMAREVQRSSNLIVLRSLTKLYALPGLRLGYAVLGANLAHAVREQMPPWSVNLLAQRAGLAALADEEYRCLTDAWMRSGTIRVFNEQLHSLRRHLRVIRSSGSTFRLLRLEQAIGPEIAARLAERGIAIRDASNFVGLDEHYVRIAVRTREENERLLTELRAILES